jgi:4-carboxymuconolactone decarboxylase
LCPASDGVNEYLSIGKTGGVLMTTNQEKQEYVDGILRRRGYILDYHKVMAKHDYEVLLATDRLVEAAYLRQRRLDRRTKELLSILSLTVLRASTGQIQNHVRIALDLGLTPEEILEAIEIALPQAGVVTFQLGLQAWREAVGATGVEPTSAVHDGGSESSQ